MRDKINQAAKGVFEYSPSALKLSHREIQVEVNAGESYQGSFSVTNEKKRFLRGQVSTDCHFLELPEEFFEGVDNDIPYIFHGESLRPGETVKGNIIVITSCGTVVLPFQGTMGVPSCQVSTGRIKDLFHFTNLAKEQPEEAAALFRNPHFEEIFLYRDNKNIALYRGLSKGASRGMALEEFLIAIHKKLPIQLTVNRQDFEYQDCSRSFSDKFILAKNNWGFGEYHIKSDSPFVIPEHKIIWTEDFAGNTCSIPFLVDVDQMQPGKNYARITVSNVCQEIEVDIVATRENGQREELQARRKNQHNLYQLTHLYIEFCMGRLDREEYLKEVESVIYTMEKSGMELVTQLFRIHLGIMEHRESTVRDGLAILEGQEEEMEREHPMKYCAYLYLKGLWAGEEEVTRSCVAKIEEFYRRDQENWKLLWFLLYLSPEYQLERKKYEEIVVQLGRNCHSPVMFVEICSILNDAPGLLTELTPGVCEAIHWGSKKQFVEKDVALRYGYLAGRLRNYSEAVLKDLCRFYEQFQDEEMLSSICKMLMNGQITGKGAFYWYNLGVEHNLKLTDLYEYYMYSIDESQEMKLQDSTLLYFLYDNHLTVTKKAMLYAYVVRNKASMEETYESYRQMMEDFALRQLEAGRVSNNLAVLYEEFIREGCVNEKIASELPAVMFCHEILCENPNIVGVYVTHRELGGEEFVPFVKGRAVVQIFTENYQIFLADALDNRYALSVDYTVNKLLHLEHLAMTCYEMHCGDDRLLLYLYDRAERMNQSGREIVNIRRDILKIANLSRYHYRKSFCSLVRYYYDNFEGELLDATLEQLDWELVTPGDRVQFIEYCTVRRYFDKAMEGIALYGYDKIDGKRLLKVSSETFAQSMEKEDKHLVQIAWHIFRSGHFDENMLGYLCRYYNGRIFDMVQVWRYAKGFSIDMGDFSERILGQILFTEEMLPDAYEVFYQYYESGKDKRLILAFMKFVAYNYMVRGWMIPSQMFGYFYKDVQIQDNVFCLIATLKYLSQKAELTEEEKKFADYHVNKLYEQKKVFPFFRNFYGKLSLPIHILDEHYVSYTSNPEYEVKIHYLISSGYEEGEYVTETMRDMFQGIRVKEFVLFQDEMLQYYISELRPEGEVITKSVSVKFDETMDNERTSSRYHMLNLMMIAQEMNEENTLIDMMREYVEARECVNTLFKPVE